MTNDVNLMTRTKQLPGRAERRDARGIWQPNKPLPLWKCQVTQELLCRATSVGLEWAVKHRVEPVRDFLSNELEQEVWVPRRTRGIQPRDRRDIIVARRRPDL